MHIYLLFGGAFVRLLASKQRHSVVFLGLCVANWRDFGSLVGWSSRCSPLSSWAVACHTYLHAFCNLSLGWIVAAEWLWDSFGGTVMTRRQAKK